MECKARLITPLEARELLLQNTCNRKLKKSHVTFFEEQLKRGEWQLTHQGIAISKSGTLLDGQHRLTAIVNTGIPAELLVFTNLPDATFSVLDTGSARSAGDILSVNGTANARAIAAGIRLYLCNNKMPEKVWVGQYLKNVGSNTSVIEEYENNKDCWEWASSVAMSNVLSKISLPGPATCLLYLATTESEFTREYARKFMETLKEGANLFVGHPILAYRNKIIPAKDISRAQERLADYIKLFNACALGQQLKIFKSQPFPPMPTLVHASESIHDEAAA